MKIEIGKEDFVALAVYASCAELPEKENKYEMIIRRIMDSLDKAVANDVAGDMLTLRARIEVLNGASAEEVLKTVLECVMEEDDVTVFKLWLITGLVCFFTFSVYALKMEVNKK